MIRFAPALVLGLLSAFPATADELPPPCGIFCKVWRNVSGRVHVPGAAAMRDDTVPIAAALSGERMPRAADLVAVHGDVLRRSRAEHLRDQAAIAAGLKRIDALRDTGKDGTSRARPPAQAAQAD